MLAGVLLIGYIHLCYGDLYCLTCFEVVSPRHCKSIRRCAEGEACFTEEYTSITGETLYNIGCQSLTRCKSQIVNPFLQRLAGSKKYVYNPDTTSCRECCSTNACNRNGCGSQDYPEIRGPACFDCQQTRDPALCRSVAVCEQGEVCQTYMKTEFGDKVFTLACAPDFVCSREYMKPDGCNQCCKTDFCSKNLCDYFNRPYGFHTVLKSDHGPGILHFETVITNIGDGYSQHTGFFTPETNGTFVFTWNIESYNESAVIALEVNGEEIIQTHTAQKYRLHYSGSSFAILNLHQGDNVYLKLIEGITKRTFTMFSGWKQHSDLLPTFYAVCPSGGCSNDMQIITNNFVYDNISNIINIEAGFYLPMTSRNEQLEYNVPIWTHRTTDNYTNYYYPNASGYIFLPNFDETSCNVLEQVPELQQSIRDNTVLKERSLHYYLCLYHVFPIDPYSSDVLKFSIKQTGLFVLAIHVNVYWENVAFSLKVNNVEMFQMSVRASDYNGYPYGNSEGSMFAVLKLEMNDKISFRNVSGSYERGSFASWLIV